MIGGPVARHAIVIIRAALLDDDRGNSIRDWDTATETESAGWAIDAADSSEDSENRDGSSTGYTLRGPPGADIVATDRVRLFGDTYLITGGVLRQPGPTPATSHTILQLTAWEG